LRRGREWCGAIACACRLLRWVERGSGRRYAVQSSNRRITERINSTLSKTTGGQASASEIDYEVYYGVALAPGVTLKPFFGFMSHPDQVDNPTPSGNLTHAVYLGVMFEVDVAHLLGLPTLNRYEDDSGSL
jgi:hypothetical protein